VPGHPTIILIDRNGDILRRWFGEASADDLEPLLRELIEK
jgi:hypothetical protein